MSHTVVRITPQDFAPPAMIDRMRSRALVVGVVFSVLALGLDAGPESMGLVPPLLAVLIHVLAGTDDRLSGAAHAAIHQRRQLGTAGPAHMGSGRGQLVAHVLCLAADCHRHEAPVSLGQGAAGSASLAKFMAHYGADKIHYYLNTPFFLVRGRDLFRRLGDPLLPAQALVDP